MIFDQSITVHSKYIYFLYELFKDYTFSLPKSTNRKPDVRTGKTYKSLIFKYIKRRKRLGQWVIIIPKREVSKVASLTMAHMHPSMYYKIGK